MSQNNSTGVPAAEVVLVGTGVAPLIAAYDLLAQGLRPIIVNPERDFFLENCELSLDPWIPWSTEADDLVARIKAGLQEGVLSGLRPVFPGAVEAWPGKGNGKEGYRDPQAPFVRARGRLWLVTDPEQQPLWRKLEDLFVVLHDADLNPQILDGVSAIKRFPACNSEERMGQGIWVPRVADVDLTRFRVGLLEFVRERLGDDGVLCEASQMQWTEQGLRFHYRGQVRTGLASRATMVFWTPALQSWIQAQLRALEVRVTLPQGIRQWEEWVLNSREAIDPSTVGIWNDCVVWGDGEGAPDLAPTSRVRVLRPVGTDGSGWASGDSFKSLHRLCQEFLRWEKFGVHRMDPKSTVLWKPGTTAMAVKTSKSAPSLWLVPGADGPLASIVTRVRESVATLGSQIGGAPT